MKEEVLNLSAEARNRLYVTPTGGIGNVNEPESSKNPSGKVLKLPWKRQKSGGSKGSLFLSPSVTDLTRSDSMTSRSDENHSSMSLSDHHPAMSETASLWNVGTITDRNSASPVQTISLPAAPRLRSHHSLEIIPTTCSKGPSHSVAVNRPPSTSVASSSASRGATHSLSPSTVGSISVACQQATLGQIGEGTPSQSEGNPPRKVKLPSHLLTPTSTPRETSIDSPSQGDLWDVLPDNSLTRTRFAQHVANVKNAENTIMQTLISPSSNSAQSLPSVTKGSDFARAMTIELPAPGKGARGLQRYPDPAPEAQFPTLVPRAVSLAPSSTATQADSIPKAAQRSNSPGDPSGSTSPLVQGSDAAPDLMVPTLSLDDCPPSDAPVSRSELALDRDGFLVIMSPGPDSATEKTEKTLVDEDRTLTSTSFPASPMKYLDLINSAGVNAASKARARRRNQVEFPISDDGLIAEHHSAPNTMMSFNYNSTDSNCCSNSSLASCEVDHNRCPSDSSPISSISRRSSQRSLSSIEHKDKECSGDDRQSSPEPSPDEDMTDCLDLEDELEGVKLMIGSRAVCPKFPLQHLQYRQLTSPAQHALLPPLPVSPSPSSADHQIPQRAPRESSLGHMLGYYQPQAIPKSQIKSAMNAQQDIGAAI
ncbi:hypothetical protein PCANC_26134 [Puccinia coronata f. sp. avenae]|uniref:Uncharacterized protein n=1 Tax=Puccinia coronata f. sp. avenae TaxID=200324 RepID=A0A2N5S6Y9_9BASI|nr:hypothetical protein PCANC_26134 [Puccinia coronata f. sp. avenae]